VLKFSRPLFAEVGEGEVDPTALLFERACDIGDVEKLLELVQRGERTNKVRQ
jgi:hypothetical protein